MGQNTSNSVWKPCEDLQKTFDLCHCQQRVYNKVLRWNYVIDQILIFHHNLQINSLKILQCDFLDFFSYFVSHSWGIPMMKITGLSHLFKWENLHNWWLTKYFFAPLYYIILFLSSSSWDSFWCYTASIAKGSVLTMYLGLGKYQLHCWLWRVRMLSDLIKIMLMCVSKMNKGLPGSDLNMGNYWQDFHWVNY